MTDVAHHVLGSLSYQETRVQTAFDDMAGNACQALPADRRRAARRYVVGGARVVVIGPVFRAFTRIRVSSTDASVGLPDSYGVLICRYIVRRFVDIRELVLPDSVGFQPMMYFVSLVNPRELVHPDSYGVSIEIRFV